MPKPFDVAAPRPASIAAARTLSEECPFIIETLHDDYVARPVIGVDQGLYDPLIGWVDADGCSVVIGDIGGQGQAGWDPERGYGRIFRLGPDDSVEVLVPAENLGRSMVLHPRLAPSTFGSHGGSIFFVGQLRPGRAGAHHTHGVFVVPSDSTYPEPFAIPPDSGCVDHGVPGAAMNAGFAPDASPQAGGLFVYTMMNNTVYRVLADRSIEPYLVFDGGRLPKIMPYYVFWGDQRWGPLAGEMIIGGKTGASFTSPVPSDHGLEFWHVCDDRSIHPVEPAPGYELGPRVAEAPAWFGPYAGQLFSIIEGSVNLKHTTKFDMPLPFDCAVHRLDAEGVSHVFATGIQAGANMVAFAGDRMIITSVRRSYSTGEYHEPDGSIAEIRWTGTDGR